MEVGGDELFKPWIQRQDVLFQQLVRKWDLVQLAESEILLVEF